MTRKFIAILLTGMLLLPLLAGAATFDNAGIQFLDRLDAGVEDGSMTREQALLHKFAYVFDHDALPVSLRPASFPPLKCATDMMSEYETMRPSLSSVATKRIEGYLTPEISGDKATYSSPLGHFTMTYLTTGGNAVPAADTNPANGIPDYVERCAEYMDESWEIEIISMGFTAPPSHPYPVSFEAMGAYGYTTVVGGTATRIVLHNTFVGFPPNDDPDGNVLGAAKVTCAHEFKHASQRAQSNWSEGGWVELDATWMEDVVYDQVNDYYNYLSSGCGITSPTLSLDNGGTGSYEDAIFQHWMSETWGEQIIIDLWNWRTTHQTQSMLLSYDSILGQYGSSLSIGYPMFAAWNYATQSRWLTGFGYGEALDYPPSSATGVNSYPYVVSGSTEHLAAQNYFVYNFGGVVGTLDIDFNGNDTADLHLMALIKKTNGSSVVEEIALDGAQDVTTSLSVPLEELSWVGLIVVNSRYYGAAATWDLTIDKTEFVATPGITVSTNVINESVEIEEGTSVPLTVGNNGDLNSVLHFTSTTMDIDPTVVLAARAPVIRPLKGQPKGPVAELEVLPGVIPSHRYAGDCVYGNNDTANIQGYYGTWWAGNETYAVKIDPSTAACSCAAGFNVRAVHFVLYLEPTSTPQVRALLASDSAGLPGTIIDTSDPITVASPAASGYFDIEIPCDFVCTDVDGGPYYVLYEFMDASGPVGIPIDSSPTPDFNFNEWGSGWQELVTGYGFAGDLMLWADVDCCGAATPEVSVTAPNGNETLAVGSVASLSWTATVLTDVKVELSRDNGSSWEILFASTPNDGSEVWTVAGASTAQALLRVGATDGSVTDVSDATFMIYNNVPWLFVVPGGEITVDEGMNTVINVGVTALGMSPGNYTAYVVLTNDAPTGPEVITVNLEVTDSSTGVNDTPLMFALSGNHPNPFNPSTRVLFSLARDGHATVDVLDLQGRVVRTIFQGDMPHGEASLEWDGRDDRGRSLASGSYIARLRSEGMTATHKMILTK